MMISLQRVLIPLVALSLQASVTAGVSIDEFKRSVWETRYLSLGGQEVHATVFLNGDSGHYETSGGTGKLSRITYRFDEVGDKYKANVSGIWSMGNMSGEFRFVSSNYLDPQQWNGDWSINGQNKGFWTGHYLRPLGMQNSPMTGSQGINDLWDSMDTCPRRPAQPPLDPCPQPSVTYGPWQKSCDKPYYHRICQLPAGGHQYLLYYPQNPGWIYWFNPTSQKFWCACPTTQHPTFGGAVANGQDFFLPAGTKGSTLGNTTFPDPGANGANFNPNASVKDVNGSSITISDAPSDLPL